MRSLTQLCLLPWHYFHTSFALAAFISVSDSLQYIFSLSNFMAKPFSCFSFSLFFFFFLIKLTSQITGSNPFFNYSFWMCLCQALSTLAAYVLLICLSHLQWMECYSTRPIIKLEFLVLNAFWSLIICAACLVIWFVFRVAGLKLTPDYNNLPRIL